MKNYFLYTILVLFVFSYQLPAQTTVPTKDQIGRIINEEVVIDFTDGTITPQSLPFDVPFLLTGELPPEIIEVKVTIINKKYQCPSNDCIFKCKECGKRSKTDEESTQLQIQVQEVEEPCECEECPPKSKFKTCTTLCPWKLNFLNKASGNNGKNKFVIQIPALQANENYQFFFDFKRSIRNEQEHLNPKLSKIIRNHFFREFHNGITSTLTNSFTRNLADQMIDTISEYYESTFLIEDIAFSGYTTQTLNNLPKFKNDMETFLIDGNSIEYVFNHELDPAYDGIYSKVSRGLNYWKTNIIDNIAYRSVRNGMMQHSDDANNKELLGNLNQLNQTDAYISRVLHGRGTLSNPYQFNPSMIDLQYKSETETVKANITTSQSELKTLKTNLEILLSTPARRRVFTLSAVDQVTLEALLKIKDADLTPQNRTDIINLETRDRDRAAEYLDILTKEINNLTVLLEDLKGDYDKLGKILEKLNNGFYTLASNSYDNQSFSTNDFFPTIADYYSRTGYYVVADAGLAYIAYHKAFSNEIRPYVGVSFHLGSLNRQSRYKLWDNCNTGRDILKNMNIMMGVTLKSLQKDPLRDDTFENVTLLTGVGLRIFEPVRLSGGVAWNRISRSNPLKESKKLTVYPYVSLSFDLDVGKHLGKFGSAIGIN